MEIGSGPIGSTSKDHQAIYQEWFNFADSGLFINTHFIKLIAKIYVLDYNVFRSCSIDGDGRITGNDATKFFAMSKLSRPELKQVYDLFFHCFNF